MINREMHSVTVSSFSGTDQFGQLRTGTETQRTVDMMIKQASAANVQDPRYVEITDIGLTKEQITPGEIVTDGARSFDVLYVIPGGRLNQAMLKERK